MVQGLKNWLLFLFLLTSIGGGMFFVQWLAMDSFDYYHNQIIPYMTLYFFSGIIALIIKMPEVKNGKEKNVP